MWTYNYTPELYHHGIKGMRWGIRRFQNKDGSLTPTGKKRYDDSTPKQIKKNNHRLKLEDKYRQKGASQKEAEALAEKRIRGEKYVAAAAGVTLAACAAYYAHKRYAVDKVISSDTEFHRIMKLNSDDVIREGPQYMAYKKGDRTKYKGILAKTFEAQKSYGIHDKEIVDVSVKAKQDIKIASPKRAKDTFERLYRENDDFREAVSRSNVEMAKNYKEAGINNKITKIYRNVNNKGSLSKNDIRGKAYDAFNVGLVNDSESGKKAARIFYDDLKKQGVNAVQDINDKKYSGYGSKNPIITFGGSYDYSRKVMDSETIQKNYNKAMNDRVVESLAKEGAAYCGIMLAGPIANKAISEFSVTPNGSAKSKQKR